MSSKNWLKPATCVGSSVWSVISVRFKTRNAAARRVVPGNGVPGDAELRVDLVLVADLDVAAQEVAAEPERERHVLQEVQVRVRVHVDVLEILVGRVDVNRIESREA